MKENKRILHGNNARVDPGTQLHSPLEALIPKADQEGRDKPEADDGSKNDRRG